MYPAYSRLSRSDTCAARGMSRVQRRRQLRMMEKNQCEKMDRMASESMTERSQGSHSGGSSLYNGRDASKSVPHCMYGRSERCSPNGRALHCVSHHREARENVNAPAISPKSCLRSATRQRQCSSVRGRSAGQSRTMGAAYSTLYWHCVLLDHHVVCNGHVHALCRGRTVSIVEPLSRSFYASNFLRRSINLS